MDFAFVVCIRMCSATGYYIFIQHPVSDAQASRAFLRLRAGYWLADLFTLARQRLRAVGVSAIHAEDICTVSNPRDYYSYRRDRVCGRQAGLVWIPAR